MWHPNIYENGEVYISILHPPIEDSQSGVDGGRGRNQQSRRGNSCSDSHTFAGRGLLAPAIINEANIRLTEEEHQLLKLGPKFIFNDPKTAARRRITELAILKCKIEKCFLRKKVCLGRPLQEFVAELDVLLQVLHNVPTIDKNINKDKLFGNEANQNKNIIELIKLFKINSSGNTI
ncbi:unnamed protein product [Rotaria sordida]|nr:unnamed protein product [Rotaria sordida]